ncbi:MAG TPA: NapC/NirT family cytochrome c [Xanthomonadaceae bacterium]|nr:NapC/NirT family cytochrome c [Xanthomonadaceae bacterium]
MAGRLRRTWTWLRSPSSGVAAGTLLLVGAIVAGVAWGGFNSFLGYSNTLDFCTSCHEMKAFVYEEYRERPHFANASGVRAICSDCHVPKPLIPKLHRKIVATFNEVPKHLMGTIDTREKFEARKPVLAQNVWDEMKADDSAACRTCHTSDATVLALQKPRARGQHEDALQSGETCIDCHKGVAHALPEGYEARATEDMEEETDFEL